MFNGIIAEKTSICLRKADLVASHMLDYRIGDFYDLLRFIV